MSAGMPASTSAQVAPSTVSGNANSTSNGSVSDSNVMASTGSSSSTTGTRIRLNQLVDWSCPGISTVKPFGRGTDRTASAICSSNRQAVRARAGHVGRQAVQHRELPATVVVQDHRRRRHAAHGGERHHRHNTRLGLHAQSREIAAGAALAPGVAAFHHERQLAPAREQKARLHALALASRQSQHRHHLIEGEPERLERAAIGLDPNLVESRLCRHPHLRHLRHRLEPRANVRGQRLEQLAVRAGQHDLGRRPAKHRGQTALAATRAAVPAANRLAFTRPEDLSPSTRAASRRTAARTVWARTSTGRSDDPRAGW